MNPRRARRLARSAWRRRQDGTATARSRRATDRLLAAAAKGDEAAEGALWQAWLRDPLDEVWERRAWPTPPVLTAAMDPDTDAGARARLGAFCARHDLLPDTPIEQATFYVLTGQSDRRHALDPDDALLTAAYHAASTSAQHAMRTAMVEAGGLDSVRVITDRPDRVLGDDEAGYVIRQLAGAGDWDRLWRTVPALPLGSVVRAAHEFGNWQPPDEAGRALLARLAQLDRDSHLGLRAEAVRSIRTKAALELSFAPDNAALVVGPGRPGGTHVYGLPDGNQIARYRGEGNYANRLALGAGAVVEWSLVGHPPDQQSWIVRNAPGRTADRRRVEAYHGLHRIPGGFLVSAGEDLLFGTADGALADLTVRRLSELDVPPQSWVIAADPTSGNLALRHRLASSTRLHPQFGPGELVLLGPDQEALARAHDVAAISGVFCGPDRILTHDQLLRTWRRDGARLVTVAAEPEEDGSARDYTDPVVMPAHGLVIVRNRLGATVWLDADTLAPGAPPPGVPELPTGAPTFSPDGSMLAVATESEVQVHDLWVYRLAELTGRSLSRLTTADLGADTAPPRPKLTPTIRDAAELVRACLEYRFGADIMLGSSDPEAGPDDIALGGRC